VVLLGQVADPDRGGAGRRQLRDASFGAGPPLGQRHRPAAAHLEVQVQPVLQRLALGTTWNQIAGPRPAGSMRRSTASPSPNSDSGTPMLR